VLFTHDQSGQDDVMSWATSHFLLSCHARKGRRRRQLPPQAETNRPARSLET
jgi:hypothetical protein